MSFLNGFDISGYGLSAQRFRINLISSNIANANTTRTDEGGPYRRREAVFKAVDFSDLLNKQMQQTGYLRDENSIDDPAALSFPKPPLMSVRVDKVIRDDSPFKLRFDPTNPDADENGYVALPNVNPVVEMADLIEATRAYQANVAAYQSTKTMAQSSIDLLKG
ncbi:MAG TPA: flagellar basal body rod protein FlgC [Epsilonproteobacteria bacterium]|jgi:flagellar basal-body rod protein FlgC|nr:flagellar basal body rod protein FlgC [Campylobacterota bacterium]